MTLDRQTFIDRFNTLVNAGQPAYDLLLAESHDTELLGELQLAHQAAAAPSSFYQQPLRVFDTRFEQAYELLRITFDYDILEDKISYQAAYRTENADTHYGIIWGRYFRALGQHAYTPEGQLQRFTFDPLTVTEGIVGTVLGSYIPMGETEAIAGLGYLAVRPAFQRRYGHGKALLDAFEQQAHTMAVRDRRHLRFIVLESEDSAASYWYRQGYRWPNGSRYQQPALHRDYNTGAALSAPSPKNFMIKVMDQPDVTDIDSAMVLLCLRTLYESWYMPSDEVTADVRQRIDQELFSGLFADFEQSLIVDAGRVALLPAPANSHSGY